MSPSWATVESEPLPAVAPKAGSDAVGSAPSPTPPEKATLAVTIVAISASIVRGRRRLNSAGSPRHVVVPT